MRKERNGYSRGKHICVLVITALFLAAEAGFVLYGFKNIEQDYVDTYLVQQEMYLAQVNTHLEYLLAQGAEEQELTAYMAESVPASGSYYGWLCKEEQVIFAKNQTVTEHLGESRSLPVFREVISGEHNYTVTREFSSGETDYMTGIVVDKGYILGAGELEKYQMYQGVSLAVLALAAFSLLIVYVQSFLKEKGRNAVISLELQEKNTALDEMYRDLTQLRQKLRKEKRREDHKQIYDLQMAQKLVEKSDRKDLCPAYYALIQIKMDEGQYYGKQQMLTIAARVPLDERHVKIEIQKGTFLLFFYRTGREEMECLLAEAQQSWQKERVHVEVRTGSLQRQEEGREWLDEFLEGKE